MTETRNETILRETLQFYNGTLGWLREHHADYAEKAKLDPHADSRPVAIWMLSGQALALATALVEMLGLGYTSQTIPTLRAIHEANRLLAAVSDPEEERIANRWLADKEVKQADARRAAQREAERISKEMEAQGLPALEHDVGELSRTIYSAMSKAAHHRRSFVKEALVADRAMVYGPDPRDERKLDYVIYSGTLLQEVLILVGGALGILWGPTFYKAHLRPVLDRFDEVLSALDLIEAAQRLGF